MKIACLQINTTVGDFQGNTEKCLRSYDRAVEAGADLVIGPELCLTGYPPRDLLQFTDFQEASEAAEKKLVEGVGATPLVIGSLTPNPARGKAHFNSAVWIERGEVRERAHKILLPTYDVFDEARYFEPGKAPLLMEWNGLRVGLTICEDIWNESEALPRPLYDRDPVRELAEENIDLLINVSASPWHLGKTEERLGLLRSIARDHELTVVQANAIGGNDELIFDGQSAIISSGGEFLARGQSFEEDLLLADLGGLPIKHKASTGEEELYRALCLGTRDYVTKCGFRQVVIGLSGGIDSAITAAIAVGALGPDNVMGILMPGDYSSDHSITDAEALARNLGIEYHTIPIKEPFAIIQEGLKEVFSGREADITEENIQARLRGVTLMAISNKLNRLVLTTGNKSELAVGYCTLYGDMCGGLSVINDVPKTWVYRLARWINREQEVIPKHSIEKPPSAELRPDQKDEDSLPPYEVLDDILRRFVEEFQSVQQIAGEGGYEVELVRKWLRQVDLNEYKRRQAAPGLKVTGKAFGIGRRMPVAQKFRHL
jgi:NAD+ synthase (glutamine-hydrolysing)